jgi:hypothetical protein
MRRYSPLTLLGGVLLLFVLVGGCAKKVPLVNLSQVDSTFLQRCTQGPGALVVEDDLYSDYWGNGYDKTPYLLLGEEGGGAVTETPTKRMVVHRRLIKVLSEKGIKPAAEFSVVHYREKTPPVEVNVWMEDNTPRKIRVDSVGMATLADWPCEHSFPRKTTFRIASLKVGDTVEIIRPVSGPDQLRWLFGSDKFCVLHSKATFGHPDDSYRSDMAAGTVDASGGVFRTSAEKEYPMVFELKKPLMPISQARLPFVLLSPRCPSWNHLRGQILRTALWMVHSGNIEGRDLVNPFLLTEVKDNQKLRRIQAVGNWMHRWIHIQEVNTLYWMRWIPREPVGKTAAKRKGNPGSWSALAFRILDDAGLKPRFALVHTHPRNPLREDQPTSLQFDTLAVSVDDENGKTHWLVPNIPYDPEKQPPPELKGRQALVLQRWWIDRDQSAGRCLPEYETILACQIATPEPVELDLITLE